MALNCTNIKIKSQAELYILEAIDSMMKAIKVVYDTNTDLGKYLTPFYFCSFRTHCQYEF